MPHRSVLWVALASLALAGYGFSSRTVEAQPGLLPFEVGDTVLFTLGDDSSRSCRIDEIKAAWVKCGSTERRGLTIGRPQPPDIWFNTDVVQSVTKTTERR